jgi:hypothetical protein
MKPPLPTPHLRTCLAPPRGAAGALRGPRLLTSAPTGIPDEASGIAEVNRRSIPRKVRLMEWLVTLAICLGLMIVADAWVRAIIWIIRHYWTLTH